MFWKKDKSKKVREHTKVTVNIATDKCEGCGKCFMACRNGVFEINYGYSYWAYPFDCVGCGKCASVCTHNAINVIPKTEKLQPLVISI